MPIVKRGADGIGQHKRAKQGGFVQIGAMALFSTARVRLRIKGVRFSKPTALSLNRESAIANKKRAV